MVVIKNKNGDYFKFRRDEGNLYSWNSFLSEATIFNNSKVAQKAIQYISTYVEFKYIEVFNVYYIRSSVGTYGNTWIETGILYPYVLDFPNEDRCKDHCEYLKFLGYDCWVVSRLIELRQI
jgi:hypothetical protein